MPLKTNNKLELERHSIAALLQNPDIFADIDGIVKEPLGGAHTDVKRMAAELTKTILENFAVLNKLSPRERINQRIDKFCAMGVVKE